MSIFSKMNPFNEYSYDISKWVNAYCIYVFYVFIGCLAFKNNIFYLKDLFFSITIVAIIYFNYTTTIIILKQWKRDIFDNNQE